MWMRVDLGPNLSMPASLTLLISNVAAALTYPLGLVFVIAAAAALARVLDLKRTSLGLLTGGLLMLWVASTPVFSKLLVQPLEEAFPPVAIENSPEADIAILLGGATEPKMPPRLRPDLTSSGDRVLHAADLYRAGKVQTIIATGGGGVSWIKGAPSEADSMADLLVSIGVPRSAIILEDQSRTTRQNAINTAKIMRERGFQSALLVTSAFHMRRAMAVFTQAGIPAVASSTDIMVAGPINRSILDWMPDPDALSRTHRALKEYLGYFVYRRRGWA